MFATESGIAQHQQRPWEYFNENPDVSSINQKEDFADFPFFVPQGNSAGLSRYTMPVTPWL